MSAPRTPGQNLALLPLFLSPAIIALVRYEKPAIRKMWPVWRAPIEDFVLIAAVAILIAAVAFGAAAWRRERRPHA